MKRFILIIVILIPFTTRAQESYDIEEIYESKYLPKGAIIIDNCGNTEDVKYILLPTKLENGKYEIEVSRIDNNIYKINNTPLYIKTRNCYKYSYLSDAILVIEPYSILSKGKIIFL